MVGSCNLFWDSCVFIRHIIRNVPEFLLDIDNFIQDIKKGERTIYYSTISLAEIRPSLLTKKAHDTFAEFVRSLGRTCVGIEPNPNIMTAAGYLKDAIPTNPSDPKISTTRRVIGTGDAIVLSTCLFLRDAMGVEDIVLHTFDEGKRSGHEGKCVPILDMERWYPVTTRHKSVVDVCGLIRTKPIHPQMDMLAGATNERPDVPDLRH